MKRLQSHRLLVAAAVSAALGIWSQGAIAGTLRVVHSIPFPEGGPRQDGTDLAWHDGHLWTSLRFIEPFWNSGTVELDPSDGSILWSSFPEPQIPEGPPIYRPMPRGYASDETYLWVTGGYLEVFMDGGVYPEDAPILGPGAPLLRPLPYSPDAETRGAAWDGRRFWFSDSKHDVIIEAGFADVGANPLRDPLFVRNVFSSPGDEPLGIAWGKDSLWVVEGSDGLVYQMDRLGNVLETWSSPATDPYGLTFDGEYLWLLDNGTKRIYQLAVPEPCTLALLGLAVSALIPVVLRRRRR